MDICIRVLSERNVSECWVGSGRHIRLDVPNLRGRYLGLVKATRYRRVSATQTQKPLCETVRNHACFQVISSLGLKDNEKQRPVEIGAMEGYGNNRKESHIPRKVREESCRSTAMERSDEGSHIHARKHIIPER